MTRNAVNIRPHLLIFLAAAAFLLVASHQAIMDLGKAWQTPGYSHGIIIPFIAAVLAGHYLAETQPDIKPSWTGLAALALAGLLLVTASFSAFGMAAQYGLIAGIAGLSLSFLGLRATRIITPALVYLIFAIPLPHNTQVGISQQLQLLSSSLGVALLDLFGIPVYQDGNIIDLGGYQLQVAEACNGLRYLFPLMSFGYLMALLMKDRMWKRILLFVSTIPIAIGLNALRIAFIGLTVDHWGITMAQGLIHDAEGWTVFLICVLLLFAELALLTCIGKRGTFRFDYLSWPTGKIVGHIDKKNGPLWASCVASALLALGAMTMNVPIDNTSPHETLALFPTTLGPWQAHQHTLPDDILQALQLDDYWLADYAQPASPDPVNLYIAYYARQRNGAAVHSPSNCIPGGGWQIAQNKIIETHPGSVPLKLTRLIIRRGNEAELVYYWLNESGRNLSDTESAKWHLLWDSIFLRRADGALIRLVTPLNHDEAAADARLQDFLSLLYPHLTGFTPEPAKKLAAP